MPILVPTAELEPGMRLSEALLADGRVMLKGGRPLTEGDINALRRRYPRMRLRIGDPVLDSIVEFEDDTPARAVALEAQQQVAKCMADVHRRFAERASLSQVQVGALQRTVRDLMDYLKSNPVSAALMENCPEDASFLRDHAGNVFYLTMLISFRKLDYIIKERLRQTRVRRLNYRVASDLVPLGLGAMIADLGLIPLRQVLKAGRPLNAMEADALREHPASGMEMVPDSTSALTRMIIRGHHEVPTGTGYPKGVGGEKLHVFNRVVRIADAYDSVTSREVFGDALSPARALWEMSRGPQRIYYDPTLVEVFATLIQPFPIGAKLRLTDGRYAAVVRYNYYDPFDPQVIIAFDTNNQRLPRSKLEGPLMLGDGRLRIASYQGEDLAYMYTTPPMPAAPGARESFATPLDAFYP